MTGVALGSPRDKKYRVVLDHTGVSDGTPNYVLTSPPPYAGKGGGVKSYDWRNPNRIITLRNARFDKAVRSEDGVYDGTPNYVLTAPPPYAGNGGGVRSYDWQLPGKLASKLKTTATMRAEASTYDVAPSDTFYVGHDQMYGEDGQVPDVDLPNPPRGRPRAIDLRNFIELGYPFLIGHDRMYGADGQAPTRDLPNPPRGKPYPLILRGAVHELGTFTLLGQDQFYGAPGQSPVHDYPNPNRARPRQQPPDIPNLQGTTLVIVVGIPFGAFDYPNPQRVRSRQQPPDVSNLQATTLAIVGIPFGVDWRNPAHRIWRPQPELLAGLQNTLLLVVEVETAGAGNMQSLRALARLRRIVPELSDVGPSGLVRVQVELKAISPRPKRVL